MQTNPNPGPGGGSSRGNSLGRQKIEGKFLPFEGVIQAGADTVSSHQRVYSFFRWPFRIVVAPSGECIRGRAGMVFVAGKTVRSMPSGLKWYVYHARRITSARLFIFTALHGMQRGLTMRFLSVCLSVCPSVCQTRVLWQNGRKICPDFYTMRKIILSSFMRRRMVVGGRPILSEILGQPARVGAKSPILNQ